MAPKLLRILLQRDDSNVQWGFRLSGGKDLAKPLTIVKVFPGTLASQYFVPGDVVLGIQGYSAKDLLHIEAIDLVRQPLKSLALLVQKTDHIPASIWGPVPVLRRPSHWLGHSSSSLANSYSGSKTMYRPASMTRQHYEAASDNLLQQEQVARTAYTPNILDSQMKQHFESLSNNVCDVLTEMPQTVYPAKMINQVSPVTHVKGDINQAVAAEIIRCGDNACRAPQHGKKVRCEVQQADKNLPELQENHKSISEIPHTTNKMYQFQESIRRIPENGFQRVNELVQGAQLSETCQSARTAQENINMFRNTCNKRVIGSTKEQSNAKLLIPDSRDADKHRPVTEKPRIPSASDVLKTHISPEFTVFTNSKSDSLLKLVLRKSLGNYSPEDFEKMKATATFVHDESDDDDVDDSDTEEDEDSGNTPCDSSLAGSSSVIFEGYWTDDSDDVGYSDDSDRQLQHRKYSDSVSRNCSRSSASSSDDYTRRQSSQLSGGGSTPSPGPPSATVSGDGVTDSSNAAPSFPAPPPPPPPPAPVLLPTVRLSTEIPDTRGGTGYEPPAAIQNAMMTKDKKPFTYTPGGLDLSQIRSPRMQRRITRNANAEGVSDQPQAAGSKTSPLVQPSPQGPLPPSALAAMQPQMAVPVFPTGGVPLQTNPAPPAPPLPPPAPVTAETVPSPVIIPVQNPEPPKPKTPPVSPPVIRPVQNPEPSKPKAPPVSPPVQVQNEPGSIYVPPVVSRSQVGSLYIPPIDNTSYQEPVVTSPQRQQTPVSPLPTLNKAPTPWMSQHQRQQQQQQQQNIPSWANREEPQQPVGSTRIIPIQIEGRSEPVQPAQPPQQQAAVNQPHTRIIPIQIEGSSNIINNTSNTLNQTKQQMSSQQQKKPVYVHNKFNPSTTPQTSVPVSPGPYNHSENQSEQNSRQYQHQQSWGSSGGNGGPTQSRSFRVLQKITDTDNREGESDAPLQEFGPPNSGGGEYNSQGVPVQQLRKLQLSDDDRALMNKFRAQVSEETSTNEEENPRYRGGHIPSRVFQILDESVDEDTFLHTESDPRYRGAAIPSRAFRMLQNMTDGTADYSEQVPRGPAVARGPQARPVPMQHTPSVDGTPQTYIPPSEQQVPEPRKYTGGAIPSRSFRILQAMTAPENCATVSSSDGRETPASLSHQGHDGNSRGQWAHYDPAYWGPEAWWGCYPSPSPSMLENSEQYWDPYSAMYAYMAEVNAAYGFTPIPYHSMYCSHPFALPRSVRYPHGGSSDSDECSGYSSTDEMAYYGAHCAHAMVPMMNGQGGVPMSPYGMPRPLDTPSIVVTQTPNTEGSLEKINVSNCLKAENANGKEVKVEAVKSPQHEAGIPQSPSSIDLDAYETAESEKCSDNEGTTTDSDTEVEEEEEKDHKGGFGSGQLHTVRSVSDINLYKNEMGSVMHNSEEETDGDNEEEEEKGHFTEGQEGLPYHLSIIYEESEHSDAESVNRGDMSGGRCPTRTNSSVTTSEDGDSSTTLDNGDDDSDGDFDIVDGESSTVSVRLPLKLKFSRSENDEEVTTVIVGDSQVRRHEVTGTAATTITEEDEHVKKQEKSPKQEVRQNAVVVEKEEGSCTDISVTLCFPSKPNLSKRVEEWRRDTSQYARDNSINMSSDYMVPYSNSLSKKSNKETAKKRSKTASDALQQVVVDEGDAYETAESDSDVSVCLSLPLRRQSQRGSGFDTINNISEEEDEEDGKASSHCEDDSSSTTSIQTVRLTSGSQGRSSGSEIEAAVTADEGDENTIYKSDNSNASIQKCVNERENVVENNKTYSKEQIENKVSENEEDDDDDDDSSESSKTSSSSRSYVSSKEVYSRKGRNNSVASLFNENATNEMKVENEDNDSEESDDSQDEKEHDIIQKIYDMCTESEKVSQSDTKQRNFTTSKDKMSECNGEPSAANTTQKLGRNEKQQSSKSQEESEEDDSGVTSDLSRPISDADTESEASRGEQSRMMKCQRASTHSRLFKLLQDECGKSDDEAEEGAAMKSRREHLTLPLCNTNGSDPDSLSSSSGVTSPASPTVTDRLVKELVQSLLQRKKGRRLKKLPLAKLHAAALRILQEDMDPYDTGSSEDSPSNHAYLLSTCGQGPHHSSNTANYPLPPQQVMYGDNYYDYCDYYDSWANAASYYGNNACTGFEYDIMPSRAFKLLSEHAQPGGFSSGIINGLWAKCPRVTSSKNVHKHLTNNSDQTDPGTCSYPHLPLSQPQPLLEPRDE